MSSEWVTAADFEAASKRVPRSAEAERLVGGSRFGCLATIGADGFPHLVPCVFVLAGGTIYTPVDHKPKATRQVQRLRNIKANPVATLLVFNMTEKWEALWWSRISGTPRILTEPDEIVMARQLLTAKYSQYHDPDQLDPIIAIEISSWRYWGPQE